MTYATLTVNDLQNAINKLRKFGVCDSATEQLTAEGSRLLSEVFICMPINELGKYLNQGIQLASLLRTSMDGENDEVLDARIEFVRISNSNALQKDPRSRLKSLSSTAKAFLNHGMIEEFAACTEAVGDAQKQLGRSIEARASYQKACLVRKHLGLAGYSQSDLWTHQTASDADH